jgi:hypothetical protein
MKKHICVLMYLVLCVLVVYSQSEYDSLKKYSYLIVQYKTAIDFRANMSSLHDFKYDTVITGLASGFFIRKKNKLFFVGSYHVFMGVDTYCKKMIPESRRAEILGIEYFDKSDDTFKYYYIDIKELNINSQVISLNEYPDAYVFEIKDPLPKEMNIYSVEKMISKKRNTKATFQYSIVYGYYYPYSGISFIKPITDYMRPTLYKGTIASNDECKDILPNIDSLNIRLNTFNKWGASGAPVFFKYKYKSKEWFEFAGVQAAGNESVDCSVAVRKQEIINLIASKNKRK